MLGTKLKEATSSFQGFHASIVNQFANYELLSQGHLYQTEMRYLLRKTRFIEIPIHYHAPYHSAPGKSVKNSVEVLIISYFD